jgi:serine/threonine protein phosphatase PrpC
MRTLVALPQRERRCLVASGCIRYHGWVNVAQVIPRFDYRIEHACVTDIGKVRERNEDAFLVAPELALFALADGMGGHAAGEVAAEMALDEVRRTISGATSQRIMDAYVTRPDLTTRRKVFTRLRRALERANERVRNDAAQSAEREGMGTTLDVVLLARDHAFVAHAGDGRVYLARARAMLQLTQDHAHSHSLKATGMMRPRQRQHRDRLVNAVGVRADITVDTLFVDLSRGDRLMLCSDGVHGQIDGEGQLGDLLREGDPAQAAKAIVARACEKGHDNATAVVIEIGERFVKREPGDRGLRAADLERARQSPLLVELPLPQVLNALSAAVEVELAPGTMVPRVIASDLVSYVLLEGLVRYPGDRRVSTGALLFPESLVGAWGEEELPVVEQTARLLRVRADDFAEVCTDPKLGNELYRRLAAHLGRLIVRNGNRAAGARPASAPDAE